MAPPTSKKRPATQGSSTKDPPKRTRTRGPARKAKQPGTAAPSPLPTIQLTPITFTEFSVIPDMSSKVVLEFLPKSLLDIVQAAEVPILGDDQYLTLTDYLYSHGNIGRMQYDF